MYHFRHEATPRRTRRGVQHASLAGETTVLSVEQQEVKVRSKRDYEPPTDAKWGSQWYLVSGGASFRVVAQSSLHC